MLIVNGAEDTDGVTTHAYRFSQAVGDVDGDGYDDWVEGFSTPGEALDRSAPRD